MRYSYSLEIIKKQKATYLQYPIGSDKDGNEISLLNVLSSEEDSIFKVVKSKILITTLYDKMNFALNGR